MTLHYRVKTTSRTALVVINCPACGATDAPATASEVAEQMKLFGLIPILKLTNVWVKCEQCQATCGCDAAFDTLLSASPSEIAVCLRYHASKAAKIVSILAFVTSIIPLLGLIMAAIALYLCRGTRGWAAKLNVFSLIISGAVTATVILLIVISK